MQAIVKENRTSPTEKIRYPVLMRPADPPESSLVVMFVAPREGYRIDDGVMSGMLEKDWIEHSRPYWKKFEGTIELKNS